MIAIKKENDQFIFEVKGLHKLWAFKNKITVPIENIVNVQCNPTAVEEWNKVKLGVRMPGVHIPFIIKAGTYYYCKGKKVFWDVVKSANCIIVDLKDCSYNQLVIEVENPEEAMKLLNA